MTYSRLWLVHSCWPVLASSSAISGFFIWSRWSRTLIHAWCGSGGKGNPRKEVLGGEDEAGKSDFGGNGDFVQFFFRTVFVLAMALVSLGSLT